MVPVPGTAVPVLYVWYGTGIDVLHHTTLYSIHLVQYRYVVEYRTLYSEQIDLKNRFEKSIFSNLTMMKNSGPNF